MTDLSFKVEYDESSPFSVEYLGRSRRIFTIRPDGSVELGEGVTLDEAWESALNAVPEGLRGAGEAVWRERIAGELEAEAAAYEREHPGMYPSAMLAEAAQLVRSPRPPGT